jgi:hypothetical protein
MPEFDRFSDKVSHTRRNIVRIGAIGAAALLHRSTRAVAQCHLDPHLCPCILRGMRVRTADGDRPIEELRAGDLIPTLFGGIRPIRRIASYTYRKSDPALPWDRQVLPVRIAPSALAPGVPLADLYLTRGHSLLIDGILFPAGSLVNGTTITVDEARQFGELEFFHIKFDRHDALYVEGTPCESLLGGDPSAESMSRVRDRMISARADAICAPLGFNGGRSEIRSRLRSALAPWFECRRQVDIVRDALDRRAGMPLPQP